MPAIEQEIRNTMLIGSCCWWDDENGWQFHYIEHEDVFERIFSSKHHVCFVKLFERTMDTTEVNRIRDNESKWLEYRIERDNDGHK